MSDANPLRLPHINSITLPSGNLQAGRKLHAPALHNQPYYRSEGFTQLLSQPSRQQNAAWPSMVSSPSSRGPLVATLQNSRTSTGSHTMVQTSGNLQAGLELRAPALHLSSYRPSGNLQAALQIRSPAPHLLSYRPSSQPAPSNSPAISQVATHRVRGPLSHNMMRMNAYRR